MTQSSITEPKTSGQMKVFQVENILQDKLTDSLFYNVVSTVIVSSTM